MSTRGTSLLRTSATLRSRTVNRLVLPNDSRTRKIAGRLVRAPRIAPDATYVLVRGGTSSPGMHLPRGFIRARRTMRSGVGGYWAMQNVEHANLSCGVPLAARYTADIVNRSGKWSKRLAEPCQRNRITSTARPRLLRGSQWRRNLNAALLEISSVNVIEPSSI